jgi:hypothetical protein
LKNPNPQHRTNVLWPLTELALATGDRRAWEALAKATRGAEVRLRLQLLRAVFRGDKDQFPRERLAFLTTFLDDNEVRELGTGEKKDVEVNPGSKFPELEVRNYAAMQIASLLHMPVEPKPEWTAEQWAALREQVRRALPR